MSKENPTMEEVLMEENAKLKEQLEAAEDALNFLIMGGDVIA